MSRLCIVIQTPDERSDTLLLKSAEVAALLAAGELRSVYVLKALPPANWFERLQDLFGVRSCTTTELHPIHPDHHTAGFEPAKEHA